MNSWSHDFGLDREGLLKFCEEDRDQITHDFFLERSGFTKKHGSVWIEDFLDFHGILVDDRPLATGQLGLCDMKKGWIFLSSDLFKLAGSPRALKALRASTLAHELGHLRLHQDEDIPHVVVNLLGDTRFCHPRSFQREMEADLYAGAFLLPLKSLKEEKSTAHLLHHREKELILDSAQVWKQIYPAAEVFGVTPTLLKKRLLDLGWIEQTSSRKESKPAKLRLKFEREQLD